MDLAAGREVLEQSLAAALAYHDAESPEALGWKRLGSRTLLIPLSGVLDGVKESYLLRLDFLTSRDWPPSAKFVDPETFEYRGVADQHHLPRLESPEAHVHPEYRRTGADAPIQLICCSATYEYYDVLHGGEEAKIWRAGDTFLVTLNAVQRAMQTHYRGRFPKHAS